MMTQVKHRQALDSVIKELRARALAHRFDDILAQLRDIERRVHEIEHIVGVDGDAIEDAGAADAGTMKLVEKIGSLWLEKTRWSKSKLQVQHREEIVKEIIATERSYNSHLATCIELFLHPLRSMQPPLLTGEQLSMIFGDIEMIYGISQAFLDQLEERTQTVGDVFLKVGPYMKGFKRYFEAYDRAIGLLATLRNASRAVADFFHKQERHPRCCKLPLPSLLIVPVQRMPRYVLLLTELIKYTPTDHPDRQALDGALVLFRSITSSINQSMAATEGQEKLLHIQQIVDISNRYLGLPFEDILQPHRKFLYSGTINKKSLTTGDIEGRDIYLCTDILITVTVLPLINRVGFKVDKIIPLGTANVIPVPSDDRMFFLVSPVKTIAFVTPTPADCKLWVQRIQDAIAVYIATSAEVMRERLAWEIQWSHETPEMIRIGPIEEIKVEEDEFEMIPSSRYPPHSVSFPADGRSFSTTLHKLASLYGFASAAVAIQTEATIPVIPPPSTSWLSVPSSSVSSRPRSRSFSPPRSNSTVVTVKIDANCQYVQSLTGAQLNKQDNCHFYPNGTYIVFDSSDSLFGIALSTGKIEIRNLGQGSIRLTSYKRAQRFAVSGGSYPMGQNTIEAFDFQGWWCILVDSPSNSNVTVEVEVVSIAYRGGGACNLLGMRVK